MARKTTRRTGQGTVYKRKDGRWEAAITHGYGESGNPKRHRVIAATQAEATQKLNEIIAKMNLGVPVTEEKRTVGEFLDYWLEEHVRGQREPKTYRFYEQVVRLYLRPNLGHLPLPKLTPRHIQTLLSRLAKEGRVARDATGKETRSGLGRATVDAARRTLRAALNLAWKWEMIRENPALKVTVPKAERSEPVFLSVKEVRSLREAARDHYLGGLVELGLLTGTRVGEATGLVWDDVDLVDRCVRIRFQLQRIEGKLVRKGLKSASSKRTLSLSDSAVAILERQRELQTLWKLAGDPDEPFNPMGLCFTTELGKPLDPKTVNVNLAKLCDRAGIRRVSFHKLRHTLASHLVASGESLSLVKDQLGHSQIALTSNTYSHAVPAALKRAADKAEELFGG